MTQDQKECDMRIVRFGQSPFLGAGGPMKKTGGTPEKGYYSFYPGETWTPNVNLYETDEAYFVCVDLSGVEKEKIDIEVVDQRMTLRGHRVVPTCEQIGGEDLSRKRCRIHLMEIDHGAFSRAVDMPNDVEKNKISANYNNGMLWIELPKK